MLTGTKEHNNIFKRELFKAYEDVISGKVKFIFDGDFGTSEADQDLTDDINNDETVSISDNKAPKNKRCKYLKTLADAYSSGKKKYAANMVSLAIERLRRKVFLDIYKGRIVAYEENNGTTPSVRVCNKSKSMKRGSWLIKFYDKAVEIQEHLKITEINPLEPLSKEDIKLLGRGYSRYTGRINLTKINLMRCEIELKNDSLLLLPHIGTRLTAMDIITMIKGEALYNELNKVFEEILNKGVFPIKKEPTKTSLLDDFLISGSMSRFDRLFQALGRYQTYKEYSNSVISEKDKLLNEIYDKFVIH